MRKRNLLRATKGRECEQYLSKNVCRQARAELMGIVVVYRNTSSPLCLRGYGVEVFQQEKQTKKSALAATVETHVRVFDTTA
jgi:hypothetical protein